MSVAFSEWRQVLSPFGEGLTGFGKRLRLLVGLGGQGVQPFLLPLDFELGDGQVFFSAATLTALSHRCTRQLRIYLKKSSCRMLYDFFRTGLPFFCSTGFPASSSKGLDAHFLLRLTCMTSLLDCADQCLILAAFRPQDLLFHHRYIDHMEVVVVDLPA